MAGGGEHGDLHGAEPGAPGSSTSPCRASPPLNRTACPGSTAARIVTWATPPSVSSTGTTASASPGSWAPVVMRRLLPGVTA